MDAATRHAIDARNQAMARVRRLTRGIGTLGLAGGLLLGAGFAHLLPTHLPRISEGTSGSSDDGGGTAKTGGGLQGPGTVPAPAGGGSHVRSGGS
jgi:hypothetical protein